MRIKINKHLLMLLLCTIAGVYTVSAQPARKSAPVTIQSVVRDTEGHPVPGAIVYGDEGAKSTFTDRTGRFSITVPPLTPLLVEADGYEAGIIDAVGEEGITLQKSPYLFGEKDKICMPFKTVEKGAVTGNVSVIVPDKVLQNDQANTLNELLNAYGAGLMLNRNIHGHGDALILIDGLPRNASNINVEEIEEISVLKDINSVILYGPQAQNGIILIKTKRGERLKRHINVKIEQGLSSVISYPKYLNSADYMTLYNEARKNDGLDQQYDPALIAKYRSGENPYRYPDVDYYGDEFLKSVRNSTRMVAEFSGGNKIARYYTNVGWNSNDALYNIGNIDRAGNNRFNIRGNVDFDITSDIKGYLDATAVFDIEKGPNSDFWSTASSMRPNDYSPLLPVSAFADPSLVEAAKRINGDFILGGTTQYQSNIYGELFRGGYTKNIQRTIQVNGGLDFNLRKILPGLRIKADLDLDMYNSYNQSINNSYAVYDATWDDATGLISAVNKINKDEETGVQDLGGGNMFRRLSVNAALDYRHTFNNVHTVNASLLGYYSTFSGNGQVILDKYAHLGIRAAYDYRKLVFADFSAVVSNSTKLAPGHRAGFSPSLGIAWIVSNSDFWNTNDKVDFLKLKASAGILLTDMNFSYYLYKDSYTIAGNYAYGDITGGYSNNILYVDRMANEKLGYEKVKTLNIGLETAFFNRTLSLDVNAFFTRHDDQVTKRWSYYPAYISTLFPYENYNADRYSGIEVALTWNKRWNNFGLEAGLNAMYAASEVIERDEAYNNAYQYRKGQAVDAIFGLQHTGFFNNAGEIDDAPVQKFGTVRPGDIRYTDQNGDKQVDEEDEIRIGKWNPKFTGAIHVTLSYRDFSLFILGEAATGHQVVYNNDYYWIDGNKKYSEEVWNRWTEQTAATATYPRLSSVQNDNNNRTSTFWMRKADYFSLSRVQLNYKLPYKLLKSTFIRELGFYLRGSNLLMAAQDVSKRQLNIGSEPQFRYYALGLKISF